jgi:hypothetical protein
MTMLAQNFKTPADLKITDAEFEALVIVLRMLERGELRHEPNYKSPTIPNGFNMCNWGMIEPCGTVACIKGWARFATGNRGLFGDIERGDSVERLFTVDHVLHGMWQDISTEQAAIALRNYLSSGEARWPEILGE